MMDNIQALSATENFGAKSVIQLITTSPEIYFLHACQWVFGFLAACEIGHSIIVLAIFCCWKK